MKPLTIDYGDIPCVCLRLLSRIHSFVTDKPHLVDFSTNQITRGQIIDQSETINGTDPEKTHVLCIAFEHISRHNALETLEYRVHRYPSTGACR